MFIINLTDQLNAALSTPTRVCSWASKDLKVKQFTHWANFGAPPDAMSSFGLKIILKLPEFRVVQLVSALVPRAYVSLLSFSFCAKASSFFHPWLKLRLRALFYVYQLHHSPTLCHQEDQPRNGL